MKVCGFTFIRNAIKFDFPIVEAIESILPICDEFIVAVGNSADKTQDLINSINSDKIKIINTVWNDALRKGGKVLALETNKAFKAIPEDYDWCFYIQGDEVVHEKYLNTILSEMKKYKDDKNVDGLLFKYKHFYGSYDYVGASYKWYRREIRVIKNNKNFYSYKDAQGFRKYNDEKLNVKLIDAYIYHYGWVKHPKDMLEKRLGTTKFWHSDEWIKKRFADHDEYDFYKNIDSLNYFTGSHPAVMLERINKKNWKFDYDISYNKLSFKDKIKRFFDKLIGWRIGEYKNYKIIK